MTARLAVSLHDVAPATWPDCEVLLGLLDELALPVTLLVVPRYHGGQAVDDAPAFATAIRARVAAGDEVVLHGYYHHDDGPRCRDPVEWLRRRVYTASEGEFDAIDRRTAAERLADGRRRLERAGLAPRGFIAPAWLLGSRAEAALQATTFAYTSTRDRLIRIADRATLAAPSLVWSSRSAWRREASARWNSHRANTLAAHPLLRAALHPIDARHPSVLRHWRRLLGQLAATRDACLESTCILAAPVTA